MGAFLSWALSIWRGKEARVRKETHTASPRCPPLQPLARPSGSHLDRQNCQVSPLHPQLPAQSLALSSAQGMRNEGMASLLTGLLAMDFAFSRFTAKALL